MKHVIPLIIALATITMQGMEDNREIYFNTPLEEEIENPVYYHLYIKNQTPLPIEVKLSQRFKGIHYNGGIGSERHELYNGGDSRWQLVLPQEYVKAKYLVECISETASFSTKWAQFGGKVRFARETNELHTRYKDSPEKWITDVTHPTNNTIVYMQTPYESLHIEFTKSVTEE